MFHLSEKQLHMLLGGFGGATFMLLCFFALFEKPVEDINGVITGLSDYSQGWIATYQTTDEKLLQEYQKENGELADGMIQQVVNLPATFAVKKENVVTLTHKLADLGQNTRYIVVDTAQEQITVSVLGKILYESSEKDGYLPARHVIAVEPQYQGQMLQIQLTGKERNQITLQGIYEGDYSQVLISAWLENGYAVIIGGLLLFGAICVSFVWGFADNRIRNKRPLLYSVMETAEIGVLFLLESCLVQLVMCWRTAGYLLELTDFVMIAVTHMLLIRSVTYKKRMLALLDAGSLVCGVFYISVIVLQGFSLIHFDTIRILAAGLCGCIIIACTIALFITVCVYKRMENRIVLVANSVLVSGMLLQILHQVMQAQEGTTPVYMIVGILLYEGIIFISALWQALQTGWEERREDIRQVMDRDQLLEAFNPNLLFASFHTLQNLIKNGSANSAKMLYYISVYFRDNLKAMRQPFRMILFEEELEHILSYLSLQKTMNPDLSFTVECKVKQFLVPRRCIEPLVENAVVHGIAGKQDKGNVVIRTYERQEGCAIQIIDDGVGFEPGRYKKDHMTSLKVILEQLETRCGARTEVVSREGKGTVITMILPIPDLDFEE